MQVGRIQHFIEHKIIIKDESGQSTEVTHIMCYIKWYMPHLHYNWFGKSAIVTQTMEEAPSPMEYMPIQRIWM